MKELFGSCFGYVICWLIIKINWYVIIFFFLWKKFNEKNMEDLERDVNMNSKMFVFVYILRE